MAKCPHLVAHGIIQSSSFLCAKLPSLGVRSTEVLETSVDEGSRYGHRSYKDLQQVGFPQPVPGTWPSWTGSSDFTMARHACGGLPRWPEPGESSLQRAQQLLEAPKGVEPWEPWYRWWHPATRSLSFFFFF